MFTNAIKGFKKDFHSIHYGIKLIVLVIFLRTFGWGFVDPYWSIYLSQFQQNYTAVGILTAVMSFSALLTIIPLLRLADKMKETILIADGEILYFFVLLAFIFAGLFNNLPLLIVALFFGGIAQTLLIIGTEAYIRRHNGKGNSGPFGFYIALDYFGWILGMVLAAFLIKYYNFNSMFLFVMPSVLASFFILPKIHERGIKSFYRGLKKYFHSADDIKGIFKDCKEISPNMIFFLILAFFDGAIRMVSFVFIPLFALSINLSLKSIALLMAVMYLPYIFSYFFSEIADKCKRMNVIAFGLFVGALSFILLYFLVTQVFVMLFAATISLSMAIIRPAYNGAITRLTPRRMLGEVTGFNNLIERLGRIIGPILTGIVADVYGIHIAFFLMGSVALGLAIMSLILRGLDYLVDPKSEAFCLKR